MQVRTINTNFYFPNEKRPLDRPNFIVRHSFTNDIDKHLSNVDPAGSFNTWAHPAFDKS